MTYNRSSRAVSGSKKKLRSLKADFRSNNSALRKILVGRVNAIVIELFRHKALSRNRAL